MMNTILKAGISSYKLRRTLVWAVHVVIFAASGVAAFLLRFDFSLPRNFRGYLIIALPIWVLVKIAVFRIAKIDRGLWRYVFAADVVRVAMGNLVASVLSFFLIRLISPPGFPRSIYVLDLMICFLATAAIRMTVRIKLDVLTSLGRNVHVAENRTFIYGAGDAGIILIREIWNNPKLSYRVLGFVDDRPEKRGMRIAGVSV